MANPWFKFFPTDWRADPALRMCSPAARGMWIDMICLMHEANPYGHLLVNGRCPTDSQVAVLTGTPSDDFPHLLRELDEAGVFSRTKDGVIYSRKMTRSSKKAAIARKNGRKGGNPSLCPQRENPASDNQQDKARDKPQKPEARSQIYEDTKVSSLSGGQKSSARFQEFWEKYPHRGGAKKKRGDAEKKYARLVSAGVSEESIIAGAVRSAGDRMVIDGYARDPTTWLNQRGWEDEIEPTFKAINGGHHGQPADDTDRLRRVITAAANGTSGKDWG